jgi:hypothetical protein
MTWFAEIKDLLAICIALLAVVVSLITIIMQDERVSERLIEKSSQC